MNQNNLSQCIADLKALEEMLIQCSRCGTCQSVCPLYKKDLNESTVARGKIFLIEALAQGKLERADEIYEYLDYCILCGRCKTNCPSGVATDEIFLKSKAIIRQVKKLPLWQKTILKTAMGNPQLLAALSPLFHIGLRLGNKKIDDGIFKAGALLSPMLGDMADRHIADMPSKALTKLYGGFNQAKDEKQRVIFYPGCATTLIYVHWGIAMIETLLHYGVSVYVPETNNCCGIPSATMGELELYREQVGKNFDYFDSIEDADTILMCCPTCEYGLGSLAEKETGRQKNKRVMDIVVFMAEVLNVQLEHKIELTGSSSLHVPCHYNGAKAPILQKFIANNFITDFKPLKNQSCCGFGGTFSLKNYPHTRELGKKKATEIKERGFSQLFTACPGCAMNLTDANLTAGNYLKATHPVVEIYEKRIKPQRN